MTTLDDDWQILAPQVAPEPPPPSELELLRAENALLQQENAALRLMIPGGGSRASRTTTIVNCTKHGMQQFVRVWPSGYERCEACFTEEEGPLDEHGNRWSPGVRPLKGD